MFRAWSAVHELNSWGATIGGTVGFIRIYKCIIRGLSPDKVIVSWDADGGSSSRKAYYAGYKGSRPPKHEDFIAQMSYVMGMLELMCVHQLRISGVESDDVVAYIVQNMFQNDERIIASADGDMMQLVDDGTKIYNPDKKGFVNQTDVLVKTGVLPENFALLKAFTGDKSDNVPSSVPGIGDKTAIKLFPELARQRVTLQDILRISQITDGRHADMYSKIVANWSDYERNYKLMSLRNTILNEPQIDQIYDQLRRPYEPYTNTDALRAALKFIGIKINDHDFDEVFETHMARVAANLKENI